MPKLNGWKRIGIVCSVLWILGAGFYTLKTTSDRDIRSAVHITQSCIDAHNGQEVGDNECLKRGEDYAVRLTPGERWEAAIVAFVPVPLAWGFIYLTLFLVRWIKRGWLVRESIP